MSHSNTRCQRFGLYVRSRGHNRMLFPSIDPWIAAGVTATTAIADAAYVMFTSAVASRRRFSAANWGGMVYLLSAFAVISYAHSWVYVLFAAIGSWVGAYISMTAIRRVPGHHQPSSSSPPTN
jgi:hypothetical protein